MNTNKNYPLAVSDLDGTISLENYLIPPQTIANILEYQTISNGKFTIATGRVASMCRKVVKVLNISMPIITCNGAVVFNPRTNKVIFKKTISLPLVLEIMNFCLELEVDVNVYSSEAIYALTTSNRVIKWTAFNAQQDDDSTKVDIFAYNTIEELKIALNTNQDDLIKVVVESQDQQKLSKIANFCDKFIEVYAVKSLHTLLDIMPVGVTKFTGIEQVMEFSKDSLENVVVFGDNDNDLSMFENAINKFCPNNAVSKIKALATAILASVENNGVGNKLIEILNTWKK